MLREYYQPLWSTILIIISTTLSIGLEYFGVIDMNQWMKIMVCIASITVGLFFMLIIGAIGAVCWTSIRDRKREEIKIQKY